MGTKAILKRRREVQRITPARKTNLNITNLCDGFPKKKKTSVCHLAAPFLGSGVGFCTTVFIARIFWGKNVHMASHGASHNLSGIATVIFAGRVLFRPWRFVVDPFFDLDGCSMSMHTNV
jgi:hypothetical protein